MFDLFRLIVTKRLFSIKFDHFWQSLTKLLVFAKPNRYELILREFDPIGVIVLFKLEFWQFFTKFDKMTSFYHFDQIWPF